VDVDVRAVQGRVVLEPSFNGFDDVGILPINCLALTRWDDLQIVLDRADSGKGKPEKTYPQPKGSADLYDDEPWQRAPRWSHGRQQAIAWRGDESTLQVFQRLSVAGKLVALPSHVDVGRAVMEQ
jgi:hypothetical protein